MADDFRANPNQQEIDAAMAIAQQQAQQARTAPPSSVTDLLPVNARPPEDRNAKVSYTVPGVGEFTDTQQNIDHRARMREYVTNESWPAQALKAAAQAFTFPGRAATGQVPEDQMIPEAVNLAMTFTGGAAGVPMAAEGAELRAGAGLYSKAERAAQAIPMDKMQGQQALAMLQKAGVSPEELKWSGVDEALKRTPQLTKDDLLRMIREGDVQLSETTLGGPKGKPSRTNEVSPTETASAPFMDEWNKTVSDRRSVIRRGEQDRDYYFSKEYEDEMANFERKLDELHGKMVNATIDEMGGLGPEPIPTRYGPAQNPQYSLTGGKNYQETLITLPAKDIYTPFVQKMKADFIEGAIKGGLENGLALDRATEIANKIADASKPHDFANYLGRQEEFNKIFHTQKKLENIFESSHWDQPNVLAHLRTNEFPAVNEAGEQSRAFNLDELQSDWAQKGRSTAFQDPKIKDEALKNLSATRQKYEEAQFDLRSYIDSKRSEFGPQPRNTQELREWHQRKDSILANDPKHTELNFIFENAKNNYQEADRAYDKISDGVPLAPYVQSTNQWTDLGLKKALSQAIDRDADVFTWTPGEVNANRYDLSKQISELTYIVPNSKFEKKFGTVLRAMDKNGNVVINKAVPPKELENYVGKDVAKKLLEQEADQWGKSKLSGLDLSVGGEGMKDFYNNIVPKRLSEVIRKATGQKPEFQKFQLQTANGPQDVYGVKLTPEMKAKLKATKEESGGYFPHFAKGGAVKKAMQVSSGNDTDAVLGALNIAKGLR